MTVLLLTCDSLHAQDYWSMAHGPFGGRITAIAPCADSIVFAGTDNRGVFFSSDNGTHWRPTALQRDAISALLSSRSQTLIASSSSGGIVISSDLGTTWQTGDSALFPTVFTEYPENQILAGTTSGVYASTDQGAHWSSLSTGLPATKIVGFGVVSDSLLLCGTFRNGVYASTDQGAHWAPARSGPPGLNILSMTGTGRGLAFAGMGNGDMYVTSDNDSSWQTSIDFGTWEQIFSDARGNLITCDQMGNLFVAPVNSSTWISDLTGLPFDEVLSVAISAHGVYYAGTSGTGFCKLDSVPGEWQTTGIPMLTISSILALSNGKILCGTTDGFTQGGGVYISGDNAQSWAPSTLQDVFVNTLGAGAGGDLAATSNGVYLSTDDGINWAQIAVAGLPHLNVSDAMSTTSNLLFAACETSGVFSITNQANSWTNTNFPHTEALHFATIDTTLFVGTTSGIYTGSGSGSSWKHLPKFQTDTISLLRTFADTGFVWLTAGTMHGVYTSSDSGSSWTQLLGDTISQPLSFTAFDAVHAIVTCQNANFSGSLRGGPWKIEPTLSFLPFTAAAVSAIPHTNNLVIGTSGGSVISLPYVLESVPRMNAAVPAAIRMYQNYPNPFNPSTKITVEIPSGESLQKARIEIFDLLGRQVALLFDGKLSEGTHTFTWNASRISSGVYFCSLTTGSETLTRKLVLMK